MPMGFSSVLLVDDQEQSMWQHLMAAYGWTYLFANTKSRFHYNRLFIAHNSFRQTTKKYQCSVLFVEYIIFDFLVVLENEIDMLAEAYLAAVWMPTSLWIVSWLLVDP